MIKWFGYLSVQEQYSNNVTCSKNLAVSEYLRFNAYPDANNAYGSGTCEMYYNQAQNTLRTNSVGNINLDGNTVIHSGNISSYTGSYLPLTGGELSSSLWIGGPSAGNSAILHELDAIVIGPNTSRNTVGYYPGIAFNHMYNYNNDLYRTAAQGWIGLRLHSTPGSELSYLVFATKPGTGTSNSGNDRPIERMNIAPDGTVSILGIQLIILEILVTLDGGEATIGGLLVVSL